MKKIEPKTASISSSSSSDWDWVEGGQAEIHDFHLEFSGRQPGEHQVRGLDVAVDQIEFLGGDERLLGLHGEFAEIRPGERSALDEFVERLAADEFHHHVGAVLVGADVVNGDDVRVLERGERAGFLDELAGGFLLQRRIVVGRRRSA